MQFGLRRWLAKSLHIRYTTITGPELHEPRDQRHMDGHVAKRHCCLWKAIHGVNRDSRLRVSARWDTIAEKRDTYDGAPEANQSPVEKFRLFPKRVELWQYHGAIEQSGSMKESDIDPYMKSKSVKDVLAQSSGNALLPCRFNSPGINGIQNNYL
ncbi:hypothetical protein EAG_01259 [Camponotus floridanus]|uniref:Uncharacterized protein n=1 Tax=Camponotus floridanus TaxID=104421 RepID=E2ALC1_CAMFO|nr:hypothetical protein EAG_01259 [Camponotus floridanus]